MSKAVEPFRFRQFAVAHDRCAMRVNTDAVLLGAWCPLPDEAPEPRILDIGTGSGVIALMLAQRCPAARITAIDIDEPSALQAADNFCRSPWSDRLTAQHISLQELASRNHRSPRKPRQPRFDLILSNPPYFRNALRNPDPRRSDARHTDSLSFDDLCRCSATLLSDDGTLALILPADAEADILATAARYNLSPTYLTRVYTNATQPPKRILIVLKKQLSTVNCRTALADRSRLCRDKNYQLSYGFSRSFEALAEIRTINCQLSTILLGSAEYHALCEDFYL